jgi:pyrroloquinoline quinone (PQQ) biosynthesis protein C
MKFYDQLVEETEIQRRELYAVPQLAEALRGNISRETYVAYLTQAYHHVSHTVPFLMSMGAQLPAEKFWLQRPIGEYIREELGHEEWILKDIAAAGGDAAAARASTPHLETQMLVAYNYDYIRRKNPVGFLGMVFMLESTSVQIASRAADTIMSSLGLPKEAFTYLVSHGALDVGHMDFFAALADRIADANDRRSIIEVAQNTFRLFAGVLRSIPQASKEVRHAA